MKKNSIFKKIKNFLLPTTNYKLPTRRGFTLIEILVVVSIIGILTAITLVSLNSAKKKATDINSVTELDQLRKAIELYRTDMGKYPGEENKEYNLFGDDNEANKGTECLAYGWFGFVNGNPSERCTSISEQECLSKENNCAAFDVALVPKQNTYGGSVSTLFSEVLVPKYISAVPFYVVEENNFQYLTGTEAKTYWCGGTNYSGYLIIFKSSNHDLKMSKLTDNTGSTGDNCKPGDICYYCLGY